MNEEINFEKDIFIYQLYVNYLCLILLCGAQQRDRYVTLRGTRVSYKKLINNMDQLIIR